MSNTEEEEKGTLVNKNLKFDLTQTEVNGLAGQLAEAIAAKANIESEKKSVVSDFKARIEEKDAQINVLSNKIRNGFEYRQGSRNSTIHGHRLSKRIRPNYRYRKHRRRRVMIGEYFVLVDVHTQSNGMKMYHLKPIDRDWIRGVVNWSKKWKAYCLYPSASSEPLTPAYIADISTLLQKLNTENEQRINTSNN